MIIIRSGLRRSLRCGASGRHRPTTLATSPGFLHDSATAVTPFWALWYASQRAVTSGSGQIGLVQNLQAGPLTMDAQLADHRVAARLGQARIEHLDDHVDAFHALRRLLAGGSHVSGKPLDGHGRALNQ